MSISTGDSRNPEKTTPGETTGEGAKTTVRDGARGGALPRGTGAAAARANASARATKSSGRSTPAKTTPAKTTAKTTPAKATTAAAGATTTAAGAKATPAKGTPTKAGSARAGAGKGAPTKAGGLRVSNVKVSDAGRAKGGGKGRRPGTPIKVATTRNWGPIAMFGVAGLIVVGIIAFGAYALATRPDPTKWKERALAIPGIANYLETNPEYFALDETGSNHKTGSLTYPTNPPVGGNHNPVWQNCMGDVYDAEIPKEQAGHSLEHGAVWVTYRPDLPQDQIDRLKQRVEGRSYTFMSPYPSLDQPISLQAWGYQLKVDNANDSRIDDFIDNLRINAASETGAACSSGITATGAVPLDLGTAPMG